MINKLSDDFLKFETFSSRLKIEGELNGENQKFRGSLRIRRDSIIWISINLPTGLPVAKMVFEKDSVKILDRINDKLYEGNYNFLEKKYGLKVGYSLLESALLNEISDCNDEGYETNRKLITYDDSLLINCVVSKNKMPVFVIDYLVDKMINKIVRTKITDTAKEFIIDYSDFDKEGEKIFPKGMEILLELNKKSLNLDINLSKIHLDKSQKYPFKISKKITVIKY